MSTCLRFVVASAGLFAFGSLTFACSATMDPPVPSAEPESLSSQGEELVAEDNGDRICEEHNGPSSCGYCKTKSKCVTCCSHQTNPSGCEADRKCSDKPESVSSWTLSPVRATKQASALAAVAE